MMEDTVFEDVGTVVAVSGGKVEVELVRGGGCQHCSARGMCFAKNTPAVFHLTTDLDLKIGDRVQLDIAPGSRVLSAVLIFAVPLIFLFLGYIVANRYLVELPSIGVAFAATALSFILIRALDKKIGGKLQVGIGRKI